MEFTDSYPGKPDYQIVLGRHATAGIHCRTHGKLADLPKTVDQAQRPKGYVRGNSHYPIRFNMGRLYLTQVLIQMHEKAKHPRRYAKNQVPDEDALDVAINKLSQTGVVTKAEARKLLGMPKKEEN